MISERTLRKWRRDALLYKKYPVQHDPDIVMLADRILKLTQELLDQHLLKGRKQ